MEPTMTTELSPETFVEAQMVDLIAPLHKAREEKNKWTRADKLITDQLKPFVQKLPDRQLVDDHGLGVGIKDGGGSRWIDFKALSDEQVLFLARNGVLALAPTKYDAALEVAQSTGDLDAIEGLGACERAIHAGSGESLVLLPSTRS